MESTYKGHRFAPEIISHAIWLYHRFTLSFRDVEDMLAERGITVSYEAIRYWCIKFGPTYTRSLHRKQGLLGDIWHVDEGFISLTPAYPRAQETDAQIQITSASPTISTRTRFDSKPIPVWSPPSQSNSLSTPPGQSFFRLARRDLYPVKGRKFAMISRRLWPYFH